jgi:hypothetical protein
LSSILRKILDIKKGTLLAQVPLSYHPNSNIPATCNEKKQVINIFKSSYRCPHRKRIGAVTLAIHSTKKQISNESKHLH